MALLVTAAGVWVEFEWATNTVAQWYRQFLTRPLSWRSELVVAGDPDQLTRELCELTGRDLRVITQALLNDLHLEFESQTQWSHRWHRINEVIHQLEQTLRPQRRLVRIAADSNLRRPITRSELTLFDHIPSAGDLCMSYGTIGKSLYNCFQDQDHRLVTEGRVTAQTELHSQAHLILAPGPTQSHPQLVEQVTEWLAAVPGGDQYQSPYYQHHGQALLAQVKDPDQMWRLAQSIAGGDRIWEWRDA